MGLESSVITSHVSASTVRIQLSTICTVSTEWWIRIVLLKIFSWHLTTNDYLCRDVVHVALIKTLRRNVVDNLPHFYSFTVSFIVILVIPPFNSEWKFSKFRCSNCNWSNRTLRVYVTTETMQVSKQDMQKYISTSTIPKSNTSLFAIKNRARDLCVCHWRSSTKHYSSLYHTCIYILAESCDYVYMTSILKSYSQSQLGLRDGFRRCHPL